MPFPPTIGVVLAGGRARRMGGIDKPLLTIGGRTLASYATERLAPQCDVLIVNANGDPGRFDKLGLAVVPDTVPDFPGPLAGILAALEWSAFHWPSVEWVVSSPGDTPFLPIDLVSRLHDARIDARTSIACAASGVRIHHAVGLWPVSLRQDLRDAVMTGRMRSIQEWASLHGVTQAIWGDEPIDPFFNINNFGDLAEASVLLQRHPLAQQGP